jgi:ribosomal protein S21
MEVTVHNNDLDRAIRDLKKQIQKDGLMRELKRRATYEKPSVKKKRKSLEAERRRRKLQRKRKPEKD